MRPKRRPGVLVACDGTRGPDVRDDVVRLLRALRREDVSGAVSRWGASGLFEELQIVKRSRRRLSPRTLLLLYGADLAFRVRWEIGPGLAQGRVVVAAPYNATAVAFGAAAGLPKRWVDSVLRFAPTPAVSVCAREREKASGWTAKPLSGFVEFCVAALEAGNPDLDARVYRRQMMKTLDAAVSQRHAFRIDRQIVRRIIP